MCVRGKETAQYSKLFSLLCRHVLKTADSMLITLESISKCDQYALCVDDLYTHVLCRFVLSMEFVLPMAMLFAWLFPVAMTVRAIVREKETRLKEYIKMVGVSDTQIRLSRLIVSGNQVTWLSCQPL